MQDSLAGHFFTSFYIFFCLVGSVTRATRFNQSEQTRSVFDQSQAKPKPHVTWPMYNFPRLEATASFWFQSLVRRVIHSRSQKWKLYKTLPVLWFSHLDTSFPAVPLSCQSRHQFTSTFQLQLGDLSFLSQFFLLRRFLVVLFFQLFHPISDLSNTCISNQ